MKKTKDTLYAVFMGLVLYIAGAAILGGITYLIDTFIGIDFVSVILYFGFATFLSRRIMNSINRSTKFITVMLCIYTALMYILKDFVSLIVIYTLDGVPFFESFIIIPITLYYKFIAMFSFDFSVSGIFDGIIYLLFNAIEILIMFGGIYNTYRICKMHY